MKRLVFVGAFAVALVQVSGCTSTSSTAGSGDQAGIGEGVSGYEYDTRNGNAETFGYQSGSGFNEAGLGVGVGPSTDVVKRIIYFDYDRAEVRESSRPVIEAHVNYLLQNPQVSVLLEGHADERGTREYNIALGDQRGGTVRELMLSLGVAPQQIGVLSYGEERPAEAGTSEDSYALNRRVEIAY